MGMRFHRSIRIAKGLRINFSKQGMGLSVGPRGMKISKGPTGTYLNVGIPGTGLYFRKKITSPLDYSDYSQQFLKPSLPDSVIFELDPNTGEIIIKYNNGLILSDPTLIRKIKRMEVYKASVRTLYERLKKDVEESTKSFVELYKQTPNLFPDNYWENYLSKLINTPPKEYKKLSFHEPMPSAENVQYEAEELAKEAAKKVFFLKRKKFISNFIEEKTKELLKEKIEKWKERKESFEKKEEKKKKEIDQEYAKEHESQIKELTDLIKGEKEAIYHSIESFLNSIALPFDFSVDYQVEGECLKSDLHLPSIDNIEKRKVNITSTGRISIKEKPKKELLHDYAIGTCGLAFFFAGNFFNISPKIKEVLISGYTQRISPETGQINDEYVYSIKFTREKFKNLILENIDPIAAINNFEHRIRILKTFELKAIEPFK